MRVQILYLFALFNNFASNSLGNHDFLNTCKHVFVGAPVESSQLWRMLASLPFEPCSFFFSLKECRPFTHYVTVNTILITLCRNSVKVHYVVLTWLRAFHEAEILVSVLASSLPAFRVCILLNLGYTSLFMPINLYKTLYSITVFYIRGLP